MNILHLCSYYNTTSLYKKMFHAIDEQNNNITQTIYIPMSINGRIAPDDHGTVRDKTVDYSRITHKYCEAFPKNSRYIYTWKQKAIINSLKKEVEVNNIDFAHAHSLFVNGGVALYLKKAFNVKYITAVRQTDIETFFKKMPHLRKKGIEIMLNAEEIVFISYQLKNTFFSKYAPEKYRKQLEKKSVVIPNGIDGFWLKSNDNYEVEKQDLTELNLLYVGTLHKRKNVDLIISAFEKIAECNPEAKLRIIAGGPEKVNIEKQIIESDYREKINFSTWTNNIEELKAEYQKSDIFIMPSIKETFGIAYLEAMSQGKPIIYTKNEGIDGFFENGEVGYAVDTSVESIVEAVQNIRDNYDFLSKNAVEKASLFSWNDISGMYIKEYIYEAR